MINTVFNVFIQEIVEPVNIIIRSPFSFRIQKEISIPPDINYTILQKERGNRAQTIRIGTLDKIHSRVFHAPPFKSIPVIHHLCTIYHVGFPLNFLFLHEIYLVRFIISFYDSVNHVTIRFLLLCLPDRRTGKRQ